MKLSKILLEINASERQGIIDTVNAYFKKYHDIDGMLDKISREPTFVVVPSYQMKNSHTGDANKCETNTYEYVKNAILKNPDNKDIIFPISGFQVTPSGFLVEHWWVYNKLLNQHYETCPFKPTELLGYVGVINYDINDEIEKSDIVWDIEFFKGGNSYSKYFK